MKTRSLPIVYVPIIALSMLACSGQKNKPDPIEKTGSAVEASKSEDAESEAETKGARPLGVRSGIIEYTYSGDKTGKSIQYFDEYGMKSAVYAEITAQGESTRGWSVTLGEDQYMWDPSRPEEGMKAKNPMVTMMMETSREEMESLTASMYEKMGMAKSGKETFQGKECSVYKGDIGKVLIWNGLLMMTEMKIGTIVSRQEATSVQVNIPVDAKYFVIPGNIRFSELPVF